MDAPFNTSEYENGRKKYETMYGRAFGTLLMHSVLGDIFTLWFVVAVPLLRAKGTSVH